MNAQQALQRADELVRERQEPDGHYHPPEWEERYISGSQIVKLTAEEYADKLLRQKRGEYEAEDFDPFWTFKGDAIARTSYHEDDGWVEELEAEVPVDEEQTDFTIVIHPDAVQAFEDWVVVGEHKAFVKDEWKKTELANRQAILGLGCLTEQAQHALDTGDAWGIAGVGGTGPDPHVRFEQAAYHDEDETWRWEFGYEPAGIHRAIVTEYGTQRSKDRIPEEQAREMLDWYRRKCLHIVKAAVEEDLDIARQWDATHPEEFARTMADGAIMEDAHDLEETAVQLRNVKDFLKVAEREEDRLKKELEKIRKESPVEDLGELNQHLDQVEVTTIRQDTWEKQVVDEDALKKRGLLEEFSRTEERGGNTYERVHWADKDGA